MNILWTFGIWILWRSISSHYCASHGAILFSFVYVKYLNIASSLYRKQIKSKLENKLYLWKVWICVHLNWPELHECHTMNLNVIFYCWCRHSSSFPYFILLRQRFAQLSWVFLKGILICWVRLFWGRLRRFNFIIVISHVGSRINPISEIVMARPGFEPYA